MRVPTSPNQSANPSTPWEAEPVEEESGAMGDANAENLYIIGNNTPSWIPSKIQRMGLSIAN